MIDTPSGKISACEVEAALSEHPLVNQAIVFVQRPKDKLVDGTASVAWP